MNIAFDGQIQLTLTTKLRWTRKSNATDSSDHGQTPGSTHSTDGRRETNRRLEEEPSRTNRVSPWHEWRKRLWPPTRWFRRRHSSTPALSHGNRASLQSSGFEKSRSKIGKTSIVIKLEVNKLNGTVLFNIPPAPSDRLWISFLDMPKIEFSVEFVVSFRHS